jgi:YkoY family integral membrane protein
MLSTLMANLPLILGTIVALVFLEGLLSADNALVLAVMVRHLPKVEQKRALRYGMGGAFVFRIIAVFLSAMLLKFYYFKVFGGLYLLYLAISHFLTDDNEAGAAKTSRFGGSFWGTVISVELADIAFSIDSIVAAVAMAPEHLGNEWKLAIVILGGVLGIVAMRFVAGYFLILLERFKGLAAGAYYLVAWIGVKLVIGGLHNGRYVDWEMPEWLFWGGMIAIVAVSMLYPSRDKKKADEPLAAVEVAHASGPDGQTPASE